MSFEEDKALWEALREPNGSDARECAMIEIRRRLVEIARVFPCDPVLKSRLDDVVGEVALTIFQFAQANSLTTSLDGLLFVSFRNQANALRREINRAKTLEDDWDPVSIPGDPSPSSDLEAEEFLARLNQCVESLPPALREAWEARHEEGLDYAGAAAKWELEDSSVRARYFRMALFLDKCLKRKEWTR